MHIVYLRRQRWGKGRISRSWNADFVDDTRRRLTMNFRWVGPVAVLLLAVVWISLGTSCDPCSSCSSTSKPTATPTSAPNTGLPSSSIAVLVQGTNATAYLPQGNWESGAAAVKVVPIETSAGIGMGGAPTTITTANIPNSCSSNSVTGQTVCVANNTDVYLINGTTLTNTLTDGASGEESFSGGDCMTCGVVVDSNTNRALVTIGVTTDGREQGVTDQTFMDQTGTLQNGEGEDEGAYQFLDLGGTPAFESPIPAGGETSEDVSIDPFRHLVLSPNEQSNYQIVNISKSTPVLYNNEIEDGELDSAAEDSTTGIALSTVEGTGDLFIADLTQAKFSSGTWTDTGSQLSNFPEFEALSAGTCGIAVAPGTHLAVVSGEFGGDIEGVVQLPSTSGSGVPAVVDYAAFEVPAPPTEEDWSQGFDPHTVTSYVSPNTKKAYAVFENGDFSYLALVDIQAMLSAPRTGAHTVTNPIPAGIVTFIAE
jgi:hypothetical protein